MKKFPNKVLTSLAVLTMAGAGLAACKDKNKLSAEFETALGYMKEVYKNEDGKTKSADFELAAVYMDDQNRTFTIDWTLEVLTAGAENSVKLVPGKTKDDKDDANKVKVDIDEESEIDVDYKLTAVMHYGEETADLASFTLKMPKLHIATWEEYVEACKNSASKADDPKNKVLSVEGIVTAIIGTKNGNSHQCVYVQDVGNKGAYYAYDLTDGDPAEKVSLGQKVRLTGQSGLYSGTYELLKPSISKVLDTTVKTVAPVDYTSLYSAASAATDASITAAQGLYVEIKDVVIGEQDLNNGYYYFKKGNLESYVRISSSVCPISKTAQTALKNDHAAKVGYLADVKGIINLFNGSFYLTPIDDAPFTFKGLPVLSDEDAVKFEKGRLSIAKDVTKSGEVALPTAGKAYTDVAISWASDNSALAAISEDGKKVTYTLGISTETVKLTATLSRGDKQETVEFTVNLLGVIPWKTVAEVMELEKNLPMSKDSEKAYYVYGTIKDDPTADKCNFTITSGDQDILVYGVKNSEGKAYGSSNAIAEIPFKKGDLFYCNANVQIYAGHKWELTNAVAFETPEVGSTYARPYDAAGAMAVINALEDGKTTDEAVYLSGVVEDDPTAEFCNFHIGTGDNSILVYGLSNDEGKAYGSKKAIADIPFVKGDVVTIKTKLQKYVDTKKDNAITPEATGAILVSHYTPTAPFAITHAGTAADPLTPAEALFKAKDYSKSTQNSSTKVITYGDKEEITVKGIVLSCGEYKASDKTQNNIVISDVALGFKRLYIYIVEFANENQRVYVNDEITVKGTLMNYNGTIEISNVVTYKADGKTVDSTDNPEVLAVTVGKSPVILGAHEGATVEGLPTETITNGNLVENVTVTANEGFVVKAVKANGVALTANNGKYSFRVEGPTTIEVVTRDANIQYATEAFNLGAQSYASASADAINWNGTVVDMKVEKGSSTTNANNYCPPTRNQTRFYNKSVLTITPKVGYNVSEITFTATTEGYASAFANSTFTNAKASASGTTVVVTPTDGTKAIVVSITATCGFNNVVFEYEVPRA